MATANVVSIDSLVDELLCIADTKWILGHWYIKAILNGRSLTDFNAMAAMAQDQLGHTRSLFSLLQDRGQSAAHLEFERSRFDVRSMELLDSPPTSWPDFLVTTSLAEYGLRVLFAAHENSIDKVVGSFAGQCERESEFHTWYLDGGLQGLNPEETAKAVESLSYRYPLALRWFTSPSTDSIYSYGYRDQSMLALAEEFRRVCEEGVANRLGTKLPQVNLDISNWDEIRRRETGSAMPERLWEFVLPTNQQAVMCRRPLVESAKDSIRFTTQA